MSRRLSDDRSGLAVVELALVMPMLLILLMYGAEVTNYAITRQRISQLALQVADNASRIGKQEVLTNTPITEKQINDLLAGAQLQSGGLDIRNNGRIIISQLIQQATPSPGGKQEIEWQRCYGALAQPSRYGKQGDVGMTGMGPAGAQVQANTNMPVIFVEVSYTYKPVISAAWAPDGTNNGRMIENASMAVRDDRDTDKDPALAPDSIYNDEHVTPSLCT